MTHQKIFSLILYICAFLLLTEWLIPLEQVTKTNEMKYFLVFVLFSMLLNYFFVAWYLGWALKCGYMMLSLYVIFHGELSAQQWIVVFFSDFKDNLSFVMAKEWHRMTPAFRSLLFFIILWQTTYLIRYWLMLKRRMLGFFFVTVLFIAVMDTFTEYEGDRAIVRVVVVGFTMLGLLAFRRLLDRGGLDGGWGAMMSWLLLLLLIISLSAGLGFSAPKPGPQWPDPLPYLQTKADQLRNGQVSKIGYGADDTRLGGPFINDDRTVFTVTSPTRQYWKVETKDVYTGKGWIASNENEDIKTLQYGDELPMDQEAARDDWQEAEFHFGISYPHIVRPYGFVSFWSSHPGYLIYDYTMEKFSTFNEGMKETRLSSYAISYHPTVYDMKEMQKTKRVTAKETSLASHYTRLPADMPERIRRLAEDITGSEDNRYDQTKAVETFFQSGEFSYDQTNVGIPSADEDYVDQFLFDTKRGYCDNFSTSMAVMLRSVGIPARWVKGYAPGNAKGNTHDGASIYEVTNNEAHSWVEVYFPNTGWVPFEPTKGFNNAAQIVNNEGPASSENQSVQEQESEVEAQKEQEQNNEMKKEKKNTGTGDFAKWLTFVRAHLGVISLSALLGAGLPLLLFVLRVKWMPLYLIRKYKTAQGEDTFENAYRSLLAQLGRAGLPRNEGQTLRSYAADVDMHFETDEMTRLTKLYEMFVYSRGDGRELWNESCELWESLLKKTTN